MMHYIDFPQARDRLRSQVNQAVADQFKLLLETKHLYQSVVVDFSHIYDQLFKQVLTDHQTTFEQFSRELCDTRLAPSEGQFFVSPRDRSEYPIATLRLQNVKLYCSHCKQRETFSPTWYGDVTQEIAKRHISEDRIALHPHRFQLFAILYQCETCKTLPISFLIKRQDWKLTIEGRSPFEEAEVPKFVPKHERWLFSEAIVAAQTGNTLAGLFYLRSFIEQFARRQTGIQDRQPGEIILDAYQALLPIKQRDQMPSLRSWYEKLGAPIHAAKPDMDLFEEAKAQIVEHFDFRRLYKISEVEPPPTGDAKDISGDTQQARAK